jgi:hypothetical protein
MTNQIKHTEADDGLKTYVTKDYNIFIMLEDNRMINQNHVANLVQAMEENPDGIRLEPILCNGKMEIIDGQHRLQALMRLERPVYYQVVPGLDIEDTVRMNVYRRNWNPMDFAYSYAARGNTNYSRYVTQREKRPQLQHRAILSFMQNGEMHRIDELFRGGRLVVSDTDENIADRFQKLDDIATKMPAGNDASARAFQRAVLSIVRRPNYDHERMMAKLDFAATKWLSHPFISTEDAQRALEGVYNESARANDRVRFF